MPNSPYNLMLSAIYYITLFFLCLLFMALSAIALVVFWPIDKARRVVHRLSRILVGFFFLPFPSLRRRAEGIENIDPKQSYIIVINHSSMVDIPSLYTLPLNFRWVSKREVFKLPFFGQFLLLHGDICIDRGSATRALEQLLADGKLWLSRGVSVAIFPEGTRSKDGQINRFKSGAFSLAKQAGVPILPVVMTGTGNLIAPNWRINWRSAIHIKVLEPISAERVASTEQSVLIEQIHSSMIEALNQLRKAN